MKTHFASPERTDEKELLSEIDFVSKNLIMSGLLHSISGLLAILDENRQIVALNDTFMEILGIENPESVLGLRPGEALQCVHSDREPAGCGTSEYCSTCGAVVAIVSSLGQDKPVEKVCALTARRGESEVDVALLVKATPITIDQKRFVLLFAQDITQQKKWASLERTFFHDMNNMLTLIVGTSEMLVEDEPSEFAETIYQSSLRMRKEIALQRCLAKDDFKSYLPMWHEVKISQIFQQLGTFFANQSVPMDHNIEFVAPDPELSVNTDISLMMRILSNMIMNALEAGGETDIVKVWIEKEEKTLCFCVWNKQQISEAVSLRIFQRNFSTKEGVGRGTGTYAMKLFGENILGGKVGFTTSKNEGTVFRFYHPTR